MDFETKDPSRLVAPVFALPASERMFHSNGSVYGASESLAERRVMREMRSPAQTFVRRSQHDNRPQNFTLVHGVEGVLDLVELDPLGDEALQRQPSLLI